MDDVPLLGIRLTRDSWPDDRRDLKCRKARPQRPRLQMSEALMLQSVPPYVDTLIVEAAMGISIACVTRVCVMTGRPDDFTLIRRCAAQAKNVACHTVGAQRDFQAKDIGLGAILQRFIDEIEQRF